MNFCIGVDFDNTLISYDRVMHAMALQRGIIGPGITQNKKTVRDRIRQLPNGDLEWQKLQAFAYGKGISQAQLVDGVSVFLKSCQQFDIKIYIISHKTEFSPLDEEKIGLRQVALRWMRMNNFFAEKGFGLSPANVYFESTRQAKINRIKELGCTHFIDDLEEIFLEESFPADVECLLYAPQGGRECHRNIKTFDTWGKIHEYLFVP